MFTVKIVTTYGYRAFSVESYRIDQRTSDVAQLHLSPKIASDYENNDLILDVKEGTIYVENHIGKTIDTVHLNRIRN